MAADARTAQLWSRLPLCTVSGECCIVMSE